MTYEDEVIAGPTRAKDVGNKEGDWEEEERGGGGRREEKEDGRRTLSQDCL